MTELKIEKVTEDSPLKAKVQRIYIKSFPLFERVSLEPFFNSVSDGVEIFALSDEEDVVAFFCTLRKGKYYYLFYLAVDEDKRGKGIGSDILSAVIKNADGATVFLDCEGIYPGCKDRAARVKRLCFTIATDLKKSARCKLGAERNSERWFTATKKFPSRKSKISGRFSVIYGRGRRLPPFLLRRVHRMGKQQEKNCKMQAPKA